MLILFPINYYFQFTDIIIVNNSARERLVLAEPIGKSIGITIVQPGSPVIVRLRVYKRYFRKSCANRPVNLVINGHRLIARDCRDCRGYRPNPGTIFRG